MSEQHGNILLPIPDNAPAPSPEVWDGIRRSMKRKDFWHVKGKLLTTAILCISATAIFFSFHTGGVTEQPAGTAAIATSASSDSLNIVPVLPESQEATTVLQKFPATYPAAAVVTAQTPVSADTSVITVTETVSETALPLKEMPVPSAVPADKKTEQIVQKALTEQEQQIENRPAPMPEASETIRVTFPSAFTPNGDGLNDTYRPILSGDVAQYILRIYNRKNQLVFQTTHPEEAWDGTLRGTPQPHGAYFCLIQYIMVDGEKKSAKGEFLLLRD